ncbi:lysine-specific demethylase JMJ32-like [Bidens hawaiensis]|uniref:lysine-specific demethylase JMJ32-like n=1 Tax=Bidens hawaiensis TaxID=980011 RepID=UPI00404B2D38
MSETSFHKDHYENLYAVVTGEKHFLLLPPTDVHRMYVREYPAARYNYSQETGEFKLEIENPPRNVPWCSVNPYPLPENKEKEMSKFPLYFNGPKPFEVTVKAGEILYLPSMWFHYVRQTPDSRGLTIAVNYWYDMQFDIKYAYFNFLQSLPPPQHQTSHDSLTNGNASDGDKKHKKESILT